jgi:CheY-like chemotaxis protein
LTVSKTVFLTKRARFKYKHYSMKKVLLVNDVKTLVEKERTVLNRSDIEIFTAMSSDEALAIHRKEKVDLIIADLDMPVISGDKLCTMIRNDGELKQVSFIMLCGGSESDLNRIARCKANAHVTKPIRPLQFIENVSRLLDIPERKSYRVLLKAKVDGKFGNEPFFCSSQDISATGLLLETDKALEKGDIMSCSFFLPGAAKIAADAEVMRIVKSDDGMLRFGVRYVGLQPAYKAAIDSFIGKRSQKK